MEMGLGDYAYDKAVNVDLLSEVIVGREMTLGRWIFRDTVSSCELIFVLIWQISWSFCNHITYRLFEIIYTRDNCNK